VVLIVIGVLVAIGGMAFYDGYQRSLPTRKPGQLPASTTTLDYRARWQLRTAVWLVSTLLCETGLHPGTAEAFGTWLNESNRIDANEAELLQQVFLLMSRMETEENLVRTLPNGALHDQVTRWLDEYLGRR
jgi:hypothetical protein